MDSLELYSLLKDYYANLDDLGWLLVKITTCSVLVVLFISVFCQKNSSALASMTVLLILLLSMKLLKYGLKKDFGLTAEQLRHVWYISYGVSYLLFVFLLGVVHKFLSLPLSKYSKLVALSFLILGLTVWIKYVCRVYLGIDNEGFRYIYGLIINSTKIYVVLSTALIATYSLIIIIKQVYQNKITLKEEGKL
jgi:hypothetical protein